MSQQKNVLERYSQGAQTPQAELCCPVDYDQGLLHMIPDEIIEKDYGCGDPSRYVQPGDTVLDLGSGGGKICYMAAQLVGESGHVIGVDMNDDMLALARRYQDEMSEKLGGSRVTFHKGFIQDLALDLAAHESWLNDNPVSDSNGLLALQQRQAEQRLNKPLIADNSIDLVISNCVLNLVDDHEKKQLLDEIFRVLKPGGRVAISDIVSDEEVPAHMKQDPGLWSGCISGAFHEKGFIDAFVAAGFFAIQYDKWDPRPWQVVENIEFRSVTLLATKPEQTACLDTGQAVIYTGPYSEVSDDDGHFYPRGERIAVCAKTFRLLTEGPYKNDFIGIQPAEPGAPVNFCAPAGTIRPASETRGGEQCCAPTGDGGRCC